MTQDAKPRRGGRPKSDTKNETPIRHVRIGPLWTRAEELALAIARRDGTVRQKRDHATGQMVDCGNVSALVEEGLRREVARLEKQLRADGTLPK